jgi:FkbM family methyltransferase
MKSFNANFLGKEILLSDKCNTVWGATRGGEIYENDLIQKFYSNIIFNKENINFLDIGANTGAFVFLPLLNSSIKCFAFEPNPIAYDVLCENIQLNNLEEHVNCFNMGVWSELKELELKVPLDKTDSGLATMGSNPSRFTYDDKSGEYDTHHVKCTTIDEFIKEQKLESIDIIKIDTEGAELDILRGGENTLREFKPMLLLEFDDKNTSQFGYKRDDILELLKTYGYTNFQLWGQSDLYASTL